MLRVGGAAPRPVDVRVVTATNRVLRDEVAAGRFREDLFFRLNVIPIQLAPLRARREDILPLAHQFLDRQQRETGRALRFGAEAEAALLAHSWPGNVRELENAVERAVVLARSEEITPEDLLLEQLAPVAAPDAAASDGTLQQSAWTAPPPPASATPWRPPPAIGSRRRARWALSARRCTE